MIMTDTRVARQINVYG